MKPITSRRWGGRRLIGNEFFNNSFTNYNFANQSYINQNEDTPNSNNEESLCKESDNKNSVSGLSDKPWTRAAKDPTLIQKGTELFVGNLAMDTVEEDLYENFQDCGDIIDVIFKFFLFYNFFFESNVFVYSKNKLI